MANSEDVDKLFAIFKEHCTEVDVLVNNAGVALGVAPIKDSEIEDWWKTFVSARFLSYCSSGY